MTRDMSHDEASESLAAAALDALSAEEQAAVLAHAASCARCGSELDALRQALAALGNASAAAVATNSPEVEQRLKRIRLRLLARAQADRIPLSDDPSGAFPPTPPLSAGASAGSALPLRPGVSAGHTSALSRGVSGGATAPLRPEVSDTAVGRVRGGTPLSPDVSGTAVGDVRGRTPVSPGVSDTALGGVRGGTPRSGVRVWMALAAAVLVAVWLYSQRAATGEKLAQAVQRANGDSAALDSARGRIASRDREIAALTGPTTSVVGLNTTGAAAATALMFWDRTDNSWAFYAHHLPPPAAGKTYQLWLLTPSSKISAGTFTPAADSSVEVHATYELPHDALKGVAVSEEPSGGAPQPTGRIVIIGTPGAK